MTRSHHHANPTSTRYNRKYSMMWWWSSTLVYIHVHYVHYYSLNMKSFMNHNLSANMKLLIWEVHVEDCNTISLSFIENNIRVQIATKSVMDCRIYFTSWNYTFNTKIQLPTFSMHFLWLLLLFHSHDRVCVHNLDAISRILYKTLFSNIYFIK